MFDHIEDDVGRQLLLRYSPHATAPLYRYFVVRGKDRYVPLPEAMLEMLRTFWTLHRHPDWLCICQPSYLTLF